MTARGDRALAHVTLTTGHVRESWRAEVADAVLERLRPILERAIATGEPQPIPPGDAALAAREGDGGNSLRIAIHGSLSGPPLVTGIVVRSDPDGSGWRALRGPARGPRLPALPDVRAPWLAVELRAGAMARPDALDWLGDAERCIAWAWLEGGGP